MKWIKSSFPGVRYREHPIRKNGVRRDQYFTIRYKIAGKDHEEGLGWASENWTAAKAYRCLTEIKENIKKGEGLQSLREKRVIEKERRSREEKEARTFSQIYITDYFPVAKENKGKRAWSAEEGLFRLWVDPVIGSIPLKIISPIHLEKIKKRMADSGKSAATIRYALALIRQVFNFARNNGFFVGDHPVGKVKIPTADNKRLRFLGHEEADMLLEELKKRSIVVYRMALLSLHTGMRAGEVFSLTWGDVDIARKILTLRDTKSGKTRSAFMTDAVQRMFSDLPRGKNSELVFPAHGSRKNPGQSLKAKTENKKDQVSKVFNLVVKNLGLNEGITDKRYKVVWHTWRHTYASWLVESGVSLYTVQKLLGHASLAMSERYSHLGKNTLQSATKNLEQSINQARQNISDQVVNLNK